MEGEEQVVSIEEDEQRAAFLADSDNYETRIAELNEVLASPAGRVH
jgi:hypothetical protein